MFFISKLMLIVLLNETYAYITQNTEIILLPASYPIGAKKIPLTLKVFGQLMQLNLRRNDQIVSPAFGIWKYNAKSVTEKLSASNVPSHCHYYHEDHISSAAVNFCHEDGLEGLIFVENDILEIRPLRNKFRTLCLNDNFREQTNISFGKPHVIKKSLQYVANLNLYHGDMFKLKGRYARNADIDLTFKKRNLTMELAIFLDEIAYNKSMLLVEHNKEKLHNTILAYVNRIQRAFNHPSANVFINIVLIRFDQLIKNPDFSQYYEDVHKQLNFFCEYTNVINFPDDNNPLHWDVALFITGENLYENIIVEETQRKIKNYNITGKAYYDGACNSSLSCAIVEFRNFDNLSAIDAAYKIGNLLGLIQEQELDERITWSEYNRNIIDRLYYENMSKICLTDEAKTENDDDNTQKSLTIELLVFFDEAAYHMYMPILDNNEERLRSMILAYVNQIQAFFHHSSFGIPIDISLIQLIILDKQPSNLRIVDGVDSNGLMNAACKYALTNISHNWDISLYLTGIDTYLINDKRKLNVLGVSHFDTLCNFNTFSCTVVEFGSKNDNQVSGFSTSYFAAHQIGLILGIPYDSIDSKCSKDKYIMTDKSWKILNKKIWSKCSRNVAKKLWKTKPCLRDRRRENFEDGLDHSRYHDLPGREWTAKAQCQLFLLDKDANVVTLRDICHVLQCETPHKAKRFFGGPALDGTYCDIRKECRGGRCVPVIEPPYILPYCAHDNWSEWKEDSCKSNCFNNSKGVIIKRRFCEHETYKTTCCSGPYYDVDLCDDSSLCTEERKSLYYYADVKCSNFNSRVKNDYRKEYFNEIMNEPGLQVLYDVKKPWTACTVYCQEESTSFNSSNFWTAPREMLELGIDPYFPDGTWCHKKDGQDYYCRQHYCRPENYSIEEYY